MSKDRLSNFLTWPMSDLECLSAASSILKDIYSVSDCVVNYPFNM